MGGIGRRLWWCGGIAGAGLALWGLWQLGGLNWLWEENHPVRPVVEALSWVAGVAGLIFTAVTLIIAIRQWRGGQQVADGMAARPPSSAAGKYTIQVQDSRAVQIGDHNTQTNHVDR